MTPFLKDYLWCFTALVLSLAILAWKLDEFSKDDYKVMAQYNLARTNERIDKLSNIDKRFSEIMPSAFIQHKTEKSNGRHRRMSKSEPQER